MPMADEFENTARIARGQNRLAGVRRLEGRIPIAVLVVWHVGDGQRRGEPLDFLFLGNPAILQDHAVGRTMSAMTRLIVST